MCYLEDRKRKVIQGLKQLHKWENKATYEHNPTKEVTDAELVKKNIVGLCLIIDQLFILIYCYCFHSLARFNRQKIDGVLLPY